MVLSFLTDLAEESSDAGTLAALGQLAAHNSDAKAMLILGKTALARGMAMDEYAFSNCTACCTKSSYLRGKPGARY